MARSVSPPERPMPWLALGWPRYSRLQAPAPAPPGWPRPRHTSVPPPRPRSDDRKTLLTGDTWTAGSPATLVPQPEPLAVFPTAVSWSWPVAKALDAGAALGERGPGAGFGGRGEPDTWAPAAIGVMASAPPARLSAAP